MAKWNESDIPDLSGRKVVVTGATSGLGLETVKMLAEHGADVWLGGRTIEKAEAAAAEVTAGTVKPLALELDALNSIKDAAIRLNEETDHIDILINNAGIMAVPYMKTVNGFESQFGVNHLGHFALTGLLWPLLLKGTEQRVVTLSSILHRGGHIDFDDLNADRSYDRQKAYSQAKLANLLFAKELARRASNIVSVAAHPGYASTNLQGRNARITGNKVESALIAVANKVVAQSSRHGAWPTVYAATMSAVNSGDFIGPSGIAELRGRPGPAKPSREAQDETVAKRLWEQSELLTGVSFP